MKPRRKRRYFGMTATEMTVIAVLGVMILCLGAVGGFFILRTALVAPQLVAEQSQPIYTPLPTKPTPTLVLTPQLFTGTPKSYLPSQSEMPSGYQLEPGQSGPAKDFGYWVVYSNAANLRNASSKAVFVMLFSFVAKDQEQARSFYGTMASNSSTDQMFGIKGMKSSPLNAEVANVDEASGGIGSFPAGEIEGKAYMITARSKNVVIVVTTVNLLETKEGFQEAIYYMSLITEKLRK